MTKTSMAELGSGLDTAAGSEGCGKEGIQTYKGDAIGLSTRHAEESK